MVFRNKYDRDIKVGTYDDQELSSFLSLVQRWDPQLESECQIVLIYHIRSQELFLLDKSHVVNTLLWPCHDEAVVLSGL